MRDDTSLTKQDVVRRISGSLPPHVSYVVTDFNRNSLAATMRSAHFDCNRRTFFLWEGVTNYLTAQAVDATFRYVARTAAQSRILFTYIHRDVLRARTAFRGSATVRDLVRAGGEPWTFGFDPMELPKYLERRGLRLVSDLDSRACRARYMGEQGRHLIGYEFYRIAVAEVTGRPTTPPTLGASQSPG